MIGVLSGWVDEALDGVRLEEKREGLKACLGILMIKGRCDY